MNNKRKTGQDIIKETNQQISQGNSHSLNWKSINGTPQQFQTANPEIFTFQEFIHDRSVQIGILCCITGILVAALSIYIPWQTIHILGCITGACLSFAGISPITKYINNCTIAESQTHKKK